jgi:hypothetical protein
LLGFALLSPTYGKEAQRQRRPTATMPNGNEANGSEANGSEANGGKGQH